MNESIPSANGDAEVALGLLIEDAGEAGCLAHIPALPGCCFRAGTVVEAEANARAEFVEYCAWLRSEELLNLTSETADACRRGADVGVVISECIPGAPVWESGNAAALFKWDLSPLDDAAITARLRFVRRVLDRIRGIAEPLAPAERTRRLAPGRRSIDETLEHVGNCIWWYCSRIDDGLPEPEDLPDEDALDRIDRLYAIAEEFLLGIPLSERATVYVLTRFPTSDPNERWTHTKVCRRQAEHVWAHLAGLDSAAGALGRAGAPADE
jgi:predicted RNase H-like HicB family nuclease